MQIQTLQIESAQTSFPLVLAELRSRNILLIKTYHYHAWGDEHPLANLGREVLIHTMPAAPLRNWFLKFKPIQLYYIILL